MTEQKQATTKKPLSSNTKQDKSHAVIKFKTKCSSTVMRDYLNSNTGLVVKVYGRIGGLLRMTSDNATISKMIIDWDQTNIDIAKHQITQIEAQVEAAELMHDDDEIEFEIDRDEPLKTDWSVNHPVFRKITTVINHIDQVLVKAEDLYFAGGIDDVQHRNIQSQTLNMLSGVIDRIRKATSPGKRKNESGEKYFPSELAKHIRSGGYRLEFFDLPADFRAMSDEYNARYKSMKSIVEERNKKRELKADTQESPVPKDAEIDDVNTPDQVKSDSKVA